MTEKISSILFVTFSIRNQGKRTSINGMIEPMISFFTPLTKKFILIEQPHPGSDTVIPFLEVYKNGKLTKKSNSFITSKILSPILKLNNENRTQISFKLRDFLSVFDFALKGKEKFDLFIGLESINALAGIILRKLGRVNKVVYYVSDYSPSRYRINFINNLYLSLDRFAATHSDFVWDVSKAMLPARIKAGLNPKKVGPDIAIEALNLVSKTIPDAKLHIYGDGEPDISRIKNLTKKLNLTEKVIFHGFISDQVQLSKETKQYAIALAPYLAVHSSPRWWADATKIRLYLAAGLPVITTKVPPLGKEVEEAQAGIITKDTAEDTAKAIQKLLKDSPLRESMKKNAVAQAKGNTWKNTYLSQEQQV